MKWLATIVLFSFFTLGLAKAGGDLPFPFSNDDQKVELKQVWSSQRTGQQVQIYQSEAGETFVLLRNPETGDLEVLVRER